MNNWTNCHGLQCRLNLMPEYFRLWKLAEMLIIAKLSHCSGSGMYKMD